MTQPIYCPNCFSPKSEMQTRCRACSYQPEPQNPVYLEPQGKLHTQYLIGKVLGHGGFGITYLAFDDNLKRRVAIKEYFPSVWASRDHNSTIHPHTGSKGQLFEKCKANFVEEARMLTQFDHPHIIRVLNLFEALGTAYYVMEYLEGETLKACIERQGPKDFLQTKAILDPLMGALEQIHKQQVYHRDIKPENIYLTENRGPILLDFGAARYYSANESRSLTAVLTPGYAPVEQYFTAGRQGPWTDIYALAATGYYMLKGEAPPEATERSQTGTALPSLDWSRDRVRVSTAQEEWLFKGLAVRIEERPANIAEWRQSYHASKSTAEPPPETVTRPTSKPSIHAQASTQTFFSSLFDRQGRYSRIEYWAANGLYGMLQALLMVCLFILAVNDASEIWVGIFTLAFLAFYLAGIIWLIMVPMTRRFHDLDLPATRIWSVLLIIPAFRLAFAKGTHGENRYGPDPLQTRSMAAAKGIFLISLLINFLPGVLTGMGAMENFSEAKSRATQSSIKANMHTLQTIVETYAVDWGGCYASSIDALHKEATQNKSPYWKEMVNPVTEQSGIGQSVGDDQHYMPMPSALAGVVIYMPQANSDGHLDSECITGYTIKAFDSKGESIKNADGTDFVLSNL